VFAATELPALLRNPNIDAMTKDVVSYYERCLKKANPPSTSASLEVRHSYAFEARWLILNPK
jgi:hypothetical protein